MKNILKALAVSAALALPSIAGAQIDNDVFVTIDDKPYQTPGTGFPENLYGQGGGFFATFSIDNFPPSGTTANFSNYLIWCIDPDRWVAMSGASYSAYTAAGFDASGLGSVGTPGHDVSEADLLNIAGMVSYLSTNWNGLSEQDRADYQGSIWSTFRGEAPVPGLTYSTPDNLDNWYVLYGNNGNQTFIFQVPAPAGSGIILLALSSLGVFAVMRRRRA